MSLRASGAVLDLGPAPAAVQAPAATSTPVSVPPLASSPVVPFVPFVPQHAPTRATEAQDSVLALFDKLTVAPTGAPEDKRPADRSPESSPNSRSSDKAQRTDGAGGAASSDIDAQVEAKIQALQAILDRVKTHAYDKKLGYSTKKSVKDELAVVEGVANWKLAFARTHPRAPEMGLLIQEVRDEFQLLEENRSKVAAEAEAKKKAAERKQDDEDMARLALNYEELLEWRKFIKTPEGRKDVAEMARRGFTTPQQLKDYRAYAASEEGQRELARQAAAEAEAKAAEKEAAAEAKAAEKAAAAEAKALEKAAAAEARKAAAAEAAEAKKAATAARNAFNKAKAKHDKEVVAERQRLLGLLQDENNAPTADEFKQLESDVRALNEKEVDFLDAAEAAGNMTTDEFTAALQLVARDEEIEINLLEDARARMQEKARAEQEAKAEEKRLARAGEDKKAMETLYRLRHQFFVEMCLRAKALRASLMAPGGRVDEEGNSLVPEWVSEMIDRMCDERDRPLEDDPDGQKPDAYTNTNYEMFEGEFQDAGYASIEAATSGGAMDMDDDEDEDGGIHCAADLTGGGWMQDDGGDPDEVLLNKAGNPMFDADEGEEEVRAVDPEDLIRPIHMQFTIKNVPEIRLDPDAPMQKNQQNFVEAEVYSALSKWITKLGFTDTEEYEFMSLDQAKAKGLDRLSMIPITLARSGISVIQVTPHVGANGPKIIVDVSAEMKSFETGPGEVLKENRWKPSEPMDVEGDDEGSEEEEEEQDDDEDLSADEETDLFDEQLQAGVVKMLKGMSTDDWVDVFESNSNLLSEADSLGRVAVFESAQLQPPLNVTPQEMATIRKSDDDYLKRHPELDDSSRYENQSYETQYAIVMALRHNNKLTKASVTTSKEDEKYVRAQYTKDEMDDPKFVKPTEDDDDREGEAEAEGGESEEEESPKPPPKKKKKKKKKSQILSDSEGSTP